MWNLSPRQALGSRPRSLRAHMNDRLHPMTLSEILDRTAQLYRSRFLVFFGIGVIPAGTVLVSAATLFAVLAWIGSAGTASSVPSMVLASMTFLFGSLVA